MRRPRGLRRRLLTGNPPERRRRLRASPRNDRLVRPDDSLVYSTLARYLHLAALRLYAYGYESGMDDKYAYGTPRVPVGVRWTSSAMAYRYCSLFC
jgi:hypothetical protein